MKRLALVGMLIAALCASKPANALEPVSIELLTLPFGTASYNTDMAMESLFKEIESPVKMMLKQTPGALFMSRYAFDNRAKMIEGKIPFTLSALAAPNVPYMAAGLPPYQDYPTPNTRIIAMLNGVLIPFVTFKQEIKSPADFVGRKVGIAEKSRPNMSTLPNKPVFDHAYGGYDKVDWQYLGFANSKDAILNGSIDVHMGNMTCTLQQAEDGSFYTTAVTMDPALMEVVSSGNAFYFVSEDPAVLKAAYDPDKDQVFLPVLMKAGSVAGQKEDVWVKGTFAVYALDSAVSDEVVEEIVYQMFTNRARLADYYEGFSYMGDTPYYSNVIDTKWIHPGMFRAMKRLNIALPEAVTAP